MASSVMVELQATTSEFMSKMGEARAEVSKLGTEGSGHMAKFSEVGKAAFFATGAAVVAVGALAVDLAVKFDATTARIQGNAQITAKAAQGIGDAFLHTAGQSTFSGQEMAAAFAPVAGVIQTVAGHTLTAADSMKVMAASSDLAEASGQPLANTTADLAAVMQAYGMKLGQVSDASNILYNTSRLTGVPLDDLTNVVDKLHGRLGIAAPDLAQTGGLMVDLAQHGIQGSRGVMVANTALTTLLGGSKSTTDELKKLGVNVFDSSGKFVGMSATLAQLSPKLAGMTDQQRLLAEKTLFGATAGLAMNSTILAGAPAFDKATAAVSAHDAVQKAAEASSHTLEGRIKTLKAGVQDYVTLLGEYLIPIITNVVSWLDKNKTIALVLAGIIGGLVVVMGTFYAVSKTIEIATKAWAAAQKLLNLAMDANPFVLIAVALVALGIALYEAYEHSKTFRDIVKTAFNDVKTAAKAVADFFVKDIPAAFDTVLSFAEKWGPLILLAIAPMIAIPLLIVQHWNTLVTWFSNLGSTIAGFFTGALTWLLKAGTDVLDGLWNGIKTVWSREVHFWTDLPGVIAGFFTGALSWLSKEGGDILSGLWSGIKTGWSNEVAFWTNLPGVIGGYFSNATTWLVSKGKDVLSGLWSGIKTVWSNDVSWLSSLPSMIVNAVGDMASTLVQKGKDLIAGLINGIKSAAGSVGSAIAGLIPGGGVVKSLLGHIPGLATGGVVAAQPGGTLVRIGEGGQDEAIIPLNGPANISPLGSGSVGGMDPRVVSLLSAISAKLDRLNQTTAAGPSQLGAVINGAAHSANLRSQAAVAR